MSLSGVPRGFPGENRVKMRLQQPLPIRLTQCSGLTEQEGDR